MLCHKLFSEGRHGFTAPFVWNSLEDCLHNVDLELDSFSRQIKTLFAHYKAQRTKCIRDIMTMHNVNQLFTYLPTLVFVFFFFM